ncbi:MAG: DUF1045 domain-containing protein [Paracoccaceae bacterium]
MTALAIEGYHRYAVFWAPPAGSPLARFGADWLGWDPAAGRRTREPDPRVAAPARYGLHATLKAPFRLADGVAPGDLDAALETFAARRAPAAAPGLVLDDALGFLALAPGGPSPGLDALAAEAVRGFDRFRAPLDEADRARRGADRLDPEARRLFETWGYPHVLGRFRFHVTLTGRLDPAEAAAARAALAGRLDGLLTARFTLDALSLFGDPGGGQDEHAGFRHLRRYPLTGRRADPVTASLST